MPVGETGDPTIGGPVLRIYYSNFPAHQFPDWTLATFEFVAFSFSTNPPPPFLRPSVSPANGATYVQGGLVPGSRAQVQGFNLSTTTRKWQASDFTTIPPPTSTALNKVNGIPAGVYHIESDQVNFQVPAGIFRDRTRSSPAGVTVGLQFLGGVTVTTGATTVQADPTALVAVGELQLADGDYPISIQIDGVSSPLDIASHTSLSFVFSIRHSEAQRDTRLRRTGGPRYDYTIERRADS
jgi:hypothetical protein